MHIQDLLSLPITCPPFYQEFEGGDFVVQISGRQFSRFSYDQAHELRSKTMKSINGSIDFVNRVSDELQRTREIARPEFVKYEEQAESKMFRDTNQNYTYYHEDNHTENTLFRKDYTNVVGRLLSVNLVLKDSFVKVGTDIAYSKEVRAFVDSISLYSTIV